MYRKHNEVKSLTTVHFCNESYILLLYTGGLLQGAGVLVGHVIRSTDGRHVHVGVVVAVVVVVVADVVARALDFVAVAVLGLNASSAEAAFEAEREADVRSLIVTWNNMMLDIRLARFGNKTRLFTKLKESDSLVIVYLYITYRYISS